MFPEELKDISPYDGYEGLGLDPLSEVVDRNNEELITTRGDGKWSNQGVNGHTS